MLKSDHLPKSLVVPLKIGMIQVVLLYLNVMILVSQVHTFGEIKFWSMAITICIGISACVILAFVRYKNQMYFWDSLKG